MSDNTATFVELPRRKPPAWPWLLYLATGVAWIIIAWTVLRIDATSVAEVSLLAGIIVLIAAAMEFVHAASVPAWRWLHVALGVVFAITGVVILARPGSSFVWLAALVGWYLMIRGFFDIVTGFLSKQDNDAWWLLVIVGVAEMLLGFWAAGNWTRSAFLLIVVVGALALARGIADIVFAFQLRSMIRREYALENSTHGPPPRRHTADRDTDSAGTGFSGGAGYRSTMGRTEETDRAAEPPPVATDPATGGAAGLPDGSGRTA